MVLYILRPLINHKKNYIWGSKMIASIYYMLNEHQSDTVLGILQICTHLILIIWNIDLWNSHYM